MLFADCSSMRRPLPLKSEALATADHNLKLTNVNYQAGVLNYMQVLTADNQYQQVRLNHIQAQALRLQETAALLWPLAAGGGIINYWFKSLAPGFERRGVANEKRSVRNQTLCEA
jgi:hypothetical protein